MILLAVLSLAFAFGTPLYGVLYYLLPGYSQLHSAFRWVFPYTLSMAALAGFGLDWLLAGRRTRAKPEMAPALGYPREAMSVATLVGRVLGWATLIVGAGTLLVVLASVFVPGPFVSIGDRILAASDLARERGFADGAMAWSYQAVGLARFGLMAVLAGGVLVLGTRRTRKKTGPQATGPLPTDPHPDPLPGERGPGAPPSPCGRGSG